jgi:HK97 family phage prohead protease
MTENLLAMELRTVAEAERVIVGVVAPYDETSYLTSDPAGERIVRGAFARSIRNNGDKVPLLDAHALGKRFGLSRRFTETDDGLLGEFVVNAGDLGDRLLENVRNGYYGGLSVGFRATRDGVRRAVDGTREVTEAKLVEVSLVGVPAYEGAALLAVRSAENLEALLAPFTARPAVNLEPIPPLGYGRR